MAKKKMTLEEKLEEAIVKEIPYKVPRNWVWIKFGTVCKLNNGYAFKSSNYKESGVPILRISNIQEFGINFDDKTVYSDYDEVLARYYVNNGDLLIAMSGATTGKTGVYNESEKAYLNQRVGNIKIVEPDLITDKFRNYLISYKGKEILNLAYGGAQPNISTTMIENLNTPLPPLKEQQRIVDKIESLFEKLDKAKELIEEARDDFENRKKTLMISGVSGELINKKFNNEICISDVIIKINSGFACSKQYEVTKDKKEAYPHLRPNNVGYYNMFNFDKIVYIPKEKVQEGKEIINKGDIIFNNTNSTELVGRAIVATKDMNVAFSNHLTKIIVDTKKVLPEWVTYSINALWSKGFFSKICKQWVGQSGVNQNVLKNEIKIALPSLEEQKEIVIILDKLLKEESKIEELTELEEQIELIKKAILAKAFRGQLGTNCEDDESALELLKDILSNQ